MFLTSASFEDEGDIPNKFTCDGADINPELEIHNVPEDAKSLALIIDDPDAPGGTFVHWVVWNIDPHARLIKQESKPSGAVQGVNSATKNGYTGPCPPQGQKHVYRFRLFALSTVLHLPETTIAAKLEEAMKGRILAEAILQGVCQR